MAHENDMKMLLPPASLEALRQLPVASQQQAGHLVLGRKSLTALNRLLDDPQLAAIHNISSLAQRLALSPASLTRLAKALGFNGFPQFQQLFRQRLAKPGHFYSEQANRLLQGEAGQGTLAKLAEQGWRNICQSLEQLDPDALNQAVHWLTASPRVRVLGYRQSSALAASMSYGLGMIRSNVEQLGSSGQGLSIGLSQLNRQDCLVVIASQPYSRETLKAAQYAQQQGWRLLAITDSHQSPLHRMSRYSLLAPTASPYYSNSFIAMQFLVEGVLSLCAQRLGAKAVHNLEAREALICELNDEY